MKRVISFVLAIVMTSALTGPLVAAHPPLRVQSFGEQILAEQTTDVGVDVLDRASGRRV